NGCHGVFQRTQRQPCSGIAAEISSAEHGRVAALYRADVFSAAGAVADEMEARSYADAVSRALRPHLVFRPLSDRLSRGLLELQSIRLAIAVRVRRVVR